MLYIVFGWYGNVFFGESREQGAGGMAEVQERIGYECGKQRMGTRSLGGRMHHGCQGRSTDVWGRG